MLNKILSAPPLLVWALYLAALAGVLYVAWPV